MSHPKSSVLLVGLLLILLPTLAILQYRWIGEVSAAERERMESGLRAASDRFASDFDGELARVSAAFQIRTGFPEDAKAVLERYQSWSESAPYPRMIRSIALVRTSPDAAPEFYKVDLRTGRMESAPIPEELGNLRDRFRPGPQAVPPSSETLMLFSAIFRAAAPFVGPRSGEFRPRGPEDFRPRGPGGPGPGPGPGFRAEGATIIELDRDVVLKELVPMLVERQDSERGTPCPLRATVPHAAAIRSSAGRGRLRRRGTGSTRPVLPFPGTNRPPERNGVRRPRNASRPASSRHRVASH